MTPSNQHSAEAIAAYPEVSEGWNVVIEQTQEDRIDELRTTFDRGRASTPVSTITDRETLAAAISAAREQYGESSHRIADAILALPSVPLVSTREAIVAAFIAESKNDSDYDPEYEYTEDASRYADALLSSGVLVDRGESDAQALEAAADDAFKDKSIQGLARVVVGNWLRARASRLRSGKAEA